MQILSKYSLLNRIANAGLATGAGQIFWYLSLPLIARLYTAEALGGYIQALAYIAMVSLVLGLRADLLILTDKQKSTWSLYSSHVALARTVVVAALAVVSGVAALKIISLSTAFWIVFVLVSALLSCSFMISGAALIKIESEVVLRKTAFTRSLIQSIMQIALYSLGVFGLMIGKILGDLSGSTLRSRFLAREAALPLEESDRQTGTGRSVFVSRRQLSQILAERKAIAVSMPQVLLNSLSQLLPFLMLPIVVSASWMGFYGLAFSIVVAPVGLIATPVRQVLISKLSDHAIDVPHQGYGDLRRVLLYSALLAALAILGFACLVFGGARALSIIFGDAWSGLYDYVLLLWIWASAGLVVTPCLALLLARRWLLTHLVLEAIQFLGRLGALAIGVMWFSGSGLAVLYPFIAWNVSFAILTVIWILLKVR